LEAFAKAGGKLARSARQGAEQVDIIITVLPSISALDEIVSGKDGMLASRRAGPVLVESGTFDP
jgi:3-hydroxyisobutyrate dehydrogenase-like beta-hydroxyacid dehydrogenase